MKKTMFLLSFVFMLSACGNNENAKVNKALENFMAAKEWEYQVENNYYYPKEVDREVFVVSQVKVNHLQDEDYLTEVRGETKVISDQKTETISTLIYDGYGKEVSSIQKQGDKWVKTVWTGTDGKVDLEINRIKIICSVCLY